METVARRSPGSNGFRPRRASWDGRKTGTVPAGASAPTGPWCGRCPRGLAGKPVIHWVDAGPPSEAVPQGKVEGGRSDRKVVSSPEWSLGFTPGNRFPGLGPEDTGRIGRPLSRGSRQGLRLPPGLARPHPNGRASARPGGKGQPQGCPEPADRIGSQEPPRKVGEQPREGDASASSLGVFQFHGNPEASQTGEKWAPRVSKGSTTTG